jgi:RNA polymerase sigma factor (sigma-70 family)
LEDKLLIWKLNRGSEDALCRIYEKYRNDLVRIAAGLVNDVSTAEDVVQNVFLMLVRSAGKYEVRKNLKGYLTSCVVNKIRNLNRTKSVQEPLGLDDVEPAISNSKAPDQCVACDEEFQLLYKAMTKLPYEQKEAVILHVQGKMKFKDIAKLQAVPIKTTLSRYNYGLNKLRSMLNSEVEK